MRKEIYIRHPKKENEMKRQFSTVLAISLVAAIQLGAADLYVTDSGTAEECTLEVPCGFQKALNIAQDNNQADTIHAASGTYDLLSSLIYKPASGEGNALTILGAGSESTILDGTNTNYIYYISDIMHINTHALSDDSNADITIRGMTFRNAQMYGGLDVFTSSADISVEDSIFSGNHDYDRSGGTNISSTYGNVTFTNNTLSGNSRSEDAPGGASGASVLTGGNITFTNNTFSGNSCSYYCSGGVLISRGGNVVLINNIFRGNRTSYGDGGGVHVYVRDGNVILTNNTFISNRAGRSHRGGGANVISSYGNIILTSNSFSDNIANERGGGGIYTRANNGNVTLVNNIFSGNSAGSGGGASIHCINATLTNNTFSTNFGDGHGGGVRIDSRNTILTNNTFSGNTADVDGGGAYIGIGNDQGKAEIYNNIFWDNNVDRIEGYFGNDLYVNSDVDRNNIGSTVKFYNNNLGPNANFTSGQSQDLYITDTDNYTKAANLKEDPLFVDTNNNDFHLSESSPLIDMGNLNAPMLPAKDFEGDDRVVDGNGDNTAMPDIGTDEFVLVTVTIADVLEYFDEAVEKGNIEGDGKGASAEKRLNTFRNMLLEAESMIATGDPDACKQLNSIDIHCDRHSKPKDLIEGVAVSELSSMILELQSRFGC